MSIDEFMWAFQTVSSRHLALNSQTPNLNEKPLIMMLPLVDMINHSPTFEPNVAILPYEDKIHDESLILV